MSEAASSPTTVDSLLDGRLRLRQPEVGHRAGTDAILLAAAARTLPGERIVDVGSGVGTVGLALGLREATLSGVLLDIDPAIGALAEENCRLNGLEGRLRVAVADLLDPSSRRAAGLAEGAATLVISNPPFLLGAANRTSPYPGRAKAHTLDPGTDRGHAAWFEAAVALLAPKGRFHMIHRPDALPALLPACEGRLGGVQLRPVFGKASEPAIRILLSGRKGSRAPMTILRGLVLQGADGRFTAEAEAIHRGSALLDP